jgi:hypothetical protein
VNAALLHDFADARRNPRPLRWVAPFMAIDGRRIDDDDEGSVASRCVIRPDHLPFDNDMVRHAPFKEFNVRREFFLEHEPDPSGLAGHGDLLDRIPEILGATASIWTDVRTRIVAASGSHGPTSQ